MIYIIEENIDRLGGVERIVSILANYFCKKEKSNVSVISMYSNNKDPFFEYNKKIQIKYLSNSYTTKKLKNKIDYMLILRRKIKKICKEMEQEDIVIFGRVSVAVKFLPYIKKGIKVIVRDAINIHNHSKIVKFLMKRFFPLKVRYFIVSSEESQREYCKFFKKKIVTMKKIYNPLGIEPDVSKNYNFEQKTIVATGRFEKQKGFENILKACKIVFSKHPDWKLKIIGDGALKQNYIKYIKENFLQKNIEIKKSVKNIEIELYSSSIYVMTSRYEGYANSLVEALACGIPSISYDWLTGVEEIIEDEKNGVVIKLKNRYDYYNGKDNIEDVENLANAINNLIEDPNKCNKLSKNAQEIYDTRNSKVILKKWDELIYEE